MVSLRDAEQHAVPGVIYLLVSNIGVANFLTDVLPEFCRRNISPFESIKYIILQFMAIKFGCILYAEGFPGPKAAGKIEVENYIAIIEYNVFNIFHKRRIF